MDDIIHSRDQHMNILLCFLDIQKCVDTIDHKLLLWKLNKYGISGKTLDWFTSYLKNRQQKVVCNGKSSRLLDISIGIPQGSGLGPILFLLFINDLPNSTDNFSFNLYADDTVIFNSNHAITSLLQQYHLNIGEITQWYKDNKLTLNLSKTKFLIIAPKKTTIPETIMFDNTSIVTSKSVKYSGINIDSDFNWNKQIQNIESKVSPLSIYSYTKQVNAYIESHSTPHYL